jgi:hypothetical protein
MGDAEEFLVYCDEAGNTGGRYLDLDQPVFAVSGLIVPPGKRDSVVQLVEDVITRSLQPRQPRPAELKSKDLLKNARGVRNLLQFLEELFELGVLPTYVVADKRYSVAAKLVETFFDPGHNPAASWLAIADNIERPKIAAEFSGYPTPLLKAFADWYLKPSAGDVLLVLDGLITEAARRSDSRLLETLRQQRVDPSRMVEAELLEGLTPGGRSIGISINLPSFQAVVQMADRLLAERGRRGRVIHDETRTFEPALQHWYDMMANAPVAKVRGVMSDGSAIRFGLRTLTGFSTSTYQEDPALGAADYVAGLVAAIGKMGLGKPYEGADYLIEARAQLVPMLLRGWAVSIGSPDFNRKFFGPAEDIMAILDRVRARRSAARRSQ